MTYIAEAEAEITMPSIEASVAETTITADKHYAFTQSTPTTEWVITHNMNKFPAVSIVDANGNEVIGEIQYTNVNSLKVKFTTAFAGKAYLN